MLGEDKTQTFQRKINPVRPGHLELGAWDFLFIIIIFLGGGGGGSEGSRKCPRARILNL